MWRYQLPSKINLASRFGVLHAGVSNMLGIEKDSERYLEIPDLYHKELLKHRTIPGTPDNVWPEWNEKEGIIDRGE